MTKDSERHEQCPMKEKCLKYEKCPMMLVQKAIGGKWKLLILWYLSFNVMRFSELKKKLPDTTPKMLTQQLRSLEEDELIHRKVYPVVPPKVEYSLTEVGKKIIPILNMMHNFGAEYLIPNIDNEEEHS